MVFGARPGMVPMVLPFTLLDRQIVDARIAQPIQTILVVLPVFVPVRAEPVERVVVPLVREPHRDPVVMEGPKFLDQTVVQLARPFPCKESDDLRPAPNELGPVPPVAVHGIAERHPRWIARVPCVLGSAHLLDRRLACEWRQWRALLRHDASPTGKPVRDR